MSDNNFNLEQKIDHLEFQVKTLKQQVDYLINFTKNQRVANQSLVRAVDDLKQRL